MNKLVLPSDYIALELLPVLKKLATHRTSSNLARNLEECLALLRNVISPSAPAREVEEVVEESEDDSEEENLQDQLEQERRQLDGLQPSHLIP